MSAPSTTITPPLEGTISGGSPTADLSKLALIIGLIGLGIAAIGLFIGISQGEPRYFLSWMIGGSFWLSILIGMLLLIILSYIFDAGWMVIIRRQLENAVSAFKWLGLIFLPMLLISVAFHGNGTIPWVWMDTSNLIPGGHSVSHDPLYTAKAGYLNLGFFAVRFVFYFAVWALIAETLRKHALKLDETGDARHHRLAYRWAAFGAPATALALSFAAIDWFKSLEYHWFSTMYGVWFFAACLRSGIAATIIVCTILAARGHLKGIYNRAHSYLLGCLLLALTVFWAYISFSQYFLQYNANIPEEVYWYNIRLFSTFTTENPTSEWYWVAMGLIFGHFFAPFLFLLFYQNKFGQRLLFASIWILVFHLLDLYWNILPAKVYDPETGGYTLRPFEFLPILWDLAMVIGVGGVCVWAFLRASATTKPIPVRDPRILESINCHE